MKVNPVNLYTVVRTVCSNVGIVTITLECCRLGGIQVNYLKNTKLRRFERRPFVWKLGTKTRCYACILKAHSMSGGSIWVSLECQCCFWSWIAGGWVYSHIVRYGTPSSYSETALTLKGSSDWISTHWVCFHNTGVRLVNLMKTGNLIKLRVSVSLRHSDRSDVLVA